LLDFVQGKQGIRHLLRRLPLAGVGDGKTRFSWRLRAGGCQGDAARDFGSFAQRPMPYLSRMGLAGCRRFLEKQGHGRPDALRRGIAGGVNSSDEAFIHQPRVHGVDDLLDQGRVGFGLLVASGIEVGFPVAVIAPVRLHVPESGVREDFDHFVFGVGPHQGKTKFFRLGIIHVRSSRLSRLGEQLPAFFQSIHEVHVRRQRISLPAVLHDQGLVAQPGEDQVRLIAGHVGPGISITERQQFLESEALAAGPLLLKGLRDEQHHRFRGLVAIFRLLLFGPADFQQFITVAMERGIVRFLCLALGSSSCLAALRCAIRRS
jgi:hypothetical protein